MLEIRCIHSLSEKVSPKGYKQMITEFSRKNGKLGTEIITILDSKGTQGIRTIYKDATGRVEKVMDDVNGRHEEYVTAYPGYSRGVYQFSEGRLRAYLPNVSIKKLSEY